LATANSAFAESEYDATFTPTGYEIGKKITDINVTIDNSIYNLIFPRYIYISADTMVEVNAFIYDTDSFQTKLTEGVFEEGKEYFIQFGFRPAEQPTWEEMDEIKDAIWNAEFYLSDGSKPVKKQWIGAEGEVDLFFKLPVLLNPVQENHPPKTGDNSNVILWSALACISLLGMMTLSSGRKEA